jgi:hypothetical protein
MLHRKKRGGRKPGSKNKRTIEREKAVATITASGADPVTFFSDLLKNEEAALDLRSRPPRSSHATVTPSWPPSRRGSDFTDANLAGHHRRHVHGATRDQLQGLGELGCRPRQYVLQRQPLKAGVHWNLPVRFHAHPNNDHARRLRCALDDALDHVRNADALEDYGRSHAAAGDKRFAEFGTCSSQVLNGDVCDGSTTMSAPSCCANARRTAE